MKLLGFTARIIQESIHLVCYMETLDGEWEIRIRYCLN